MRTFAGMVSWCSTLGPSCSFLSLKTISAGNLLPSIPAHNATVKPFFFAPVDAMRAVLSPRIVLVEFGVQSNRTHGLIHVGDIVQCVVVTLAEVDDGTSEG